MRLNKMVHVIRNDSIPTSSSTCSFSCFRREVDVAVVAEWLRRLTRNQIPSGSVGSSPTDRGTFSPVLVKL